MNTEITAHRKLQPYGLTTVNLDAIKLCQEATGRPPGKTGPRSLHHLASSHGFSPEHTKVYLLRMTSVRLHATFQSENTCGTVFTIRFPIRFDG